MLNTLFYRQAKRAFVFTLALCAFLYVLWYVVFEWRIFEYPNYGEKPYYYSPNREYYITMHQSLWQEFMTKDPGLVNAKLFDKNGNLLYQNDVLILDSGPRWVSSENSGTNEVFFQDSGGPDWGFTLPSSPGKKP